MSSNKSEVHEEKTRWSLTKNAQTRQSTPTSTRRNTSVPIRAFSQRELGDLSQERDEEKKGRLGGSLLAKFAKARLKAKARSDSSGSGSERDRAETTPPKDFAGLRKSARHRKSTEIRDSEVVHPEMGETFNKRASVTYRVSRERKSSWRFSLPEQLHSRIGEDKRVFPAHSWSTMSSADPNDLFTLGRKLGESPHASVFKATVKETGFVVASKIIPVHVHGDIVVSVPQVAGEIALLQRARHPNVARYYGTFYNDDFMWVITEYCTMSSIGSILKYGIHFSEHQLAAVVTSVLHGLAYLHTMGIIHRNLKCSNILMNELGDAKLADFGIPWNWLRALEQAKGINSSTHFVAPEVLAGEQWQQAADIWSLGIAVIEMADGQPPYEIEDPSRAAYLLANRPPPTVQEPSKYSPAFIDFLSLCLQKDPKKRPSARELLRHDFVNSQDSRRSEEVITRLLQQYQRARSKKAALLSEKTAKQELSPKESERRQTLHDEERTDYTLTEAEGETLTFTGTNTEHGLEDDDSSLLSSDSSLSDSDSPTNTAVSTSLTGMAINRSSAEHRLSTSESHIPYSYSTSAPAPFLSIRTLREFDEKGEEIRRAHHEEEEEKSLSLSARLRTTAQQSIRALLTSAKLPIDEINAIASTAPPPPLTPGSAKKEVSFATEKRESDPDKKKEKESEKLNGLASTRTTRQVGTGGRIMGDNYGDRPLDGDAEDDTADVEHYLNLSIMQIVKELLSWKLRCQQLEIEMAQLIMEKQKQSQLIQQSQQLLQYSLSSQLPPTSLHGSPLNQMSSINRQLYYSASVPSSPPSNASSPMFARAAQPVLRAQKESDKRRRSTSSMQNIW